MSDRVEKLKNDDLPEKIAAAYKENGYFTELFGPTEAIPFKTVIAVNQEIPEISNCKFLINSVPGDYYEVDGFNQEDVFIQLSVTLPIDVKEEGVADLARLLLLLNKGLELPGFGLSEPDEACYFKHVLRCQRQTVETSKILALTDYTELILSMFLSAIQEVAEGKITLNEYIKRCLEENQQDNK